MTSPFTYPTPSAASIAQLEMEAALTDAVGQLSPSSRRMYVIDARQLAGWMLEQGVTPATMTRSHAITYRSSLQEHYARATAARKFVVARRILDEQRTLGKSASNPFVDLQGFTIENETTHVVLKEEQAQALLDAIDTSTLMGLRDYVVMLFLLRTGVRRSEAAALRFADLTMTQGHSIAIIRHGKGDKRRTVKVPVDVWREITLYTQALRERHFEDHQRELDAQGSGGDPEQRRAIEERHSISLNDPLFVSFRRGDHPTRRPMGDKAIETQVKAYAEKLSVPLTPHGLRATFITLALEHNAKLQQVQYAAGHHDPRTTERYQGRKLNVDDNAVDYVKVKRHDRE
ncbi:MAG: site-specific integrase [Chloroflexota bacterium]|nr:site-specific integrase [Chloroflexota bacterium]